MERQAEKTLGFVAVGLVVVDIALDVFNHFGWIIANLGYHGLEHLDEVGLVMPNGTVIAVNVEVSVETVTRSTAGKVVVVFDAFEDVAKLVVAI